MKKLAILLIGVTMLFASCKKDLDKPEINVFPTGNEWSVGRILDSLQKLNTYQFDTVFDSNAENAIVKGYVIGDEASGNIYRTFYLRGEDGKCVAVYRKGASEGGSEEFNVRAGDYIGYKLYGSIISSYNNLPQIQVQAQNPNELIVIYKKNCTDKVQPIETTIDSINAGKHLCDLVKLSNVQFESYQGLTYAEPNSTTNRNLVSCSGESVIVRTSNYASFAEDPLPEGRGTLISVVSVYNSTWQLLLRNPREDVNMTESRCGEGGEVQPMPYAQSFASSFGTYTTYNVLGGQTWIIDYQTAKMTGKDGDFYENEDWLISSPVEIVNVEHAKAVVNYVAQYNGPDNDVTIQISSDYEFGEDPRDYTWTQLNATFPNTGGWNDFQNKEVSLDEFIGQTVTLAVKFISTDTQSRTIEVKSITIEEGEAGGGGGGTLVGDGTRENPYTAADIITMGIQSSDGNKYWVKDYIVGFINSDYSYVYSSEAGDVKSNIIMSSDVNTTVDDACIPIQLPFGAVREGLNLADHPENYQQEVLLYGTLEKYFQKPGVKNVSYAEINGNSYGIEPGGGGTEYFNEVLTSQASYNTFTAYNVEGTQQWTYNSSYGAVMSGYEGGTSYANEDWFISAPIDLSASTNPVLTFEHARGPAGSINVGVAEGYYKVFVSTEYVSGDPREVTWTELPDVIHGTSAWGWVSSGQLAIPAACLTDNCRIAFRYLSIDDASATWEVKNVIISE